MELPHNIEAERNVVGACMLSGAAVSEAMEMLNPGDFFSHVYGSIYRAIGSLSVSGKPVTAQTVAVELGGTKGTEEGRHLLEELGGPDVVFRALEGVEPSEARFWIDEVLRKKSQRELAQYADWVRQVAYSNPKDISKARAKVEERLASLAGGVTNDITPVSSMSELRDRIDHYITAPDAITGLETGWSKFDQMLDGLQDGNVTIVYAPSSRFKSMFVANLGHRLALNSHAGLWFTTEMPTLQVQERLLQIHSGLNLKQLRRDGQIHQNTATIGRAMDELGKLPIYICDSTELDIGSIRAKAMRYKKWHDIKYIIVDLVDMVSTSGFKDDSVAQQSMVMRQMKGIAKQVGVHVILVSHVSKGEKSMHRNPFLMPEDMKGTSSKYQDVDCAISLMPVKTDSETGKWVGLTLDEITNRIKQDGQLMVLVTFTKNRHGELGDIPFVVSLRGGGRMWPLGRSSTLTQAISSLPPQAPEPVALLDDDDEYADLDEDEFDEITGLADAA